jgi:hypothetical protein
MTDARPVSVDYSLVSGGEREVVGDTHRSLTAVPAVGVTTNLLEVVPHWQPEATSPAL